MTSLGSARDHDFGLHRRLGIEAEMPEAALLVGELGRHRTAVDVDDSVFRVSGVVLVDRFDQRGGDVRAAALHDEGHVLVGRALERDQRVGRLRLVVERHQLELLAQRAALGRVDVVDDVLHLLQVGVAHLRERTRQRVRIGDLDGVLCSRRADRYSARHQHRARNRCENPHCHNLPPPLTPLSAGQEPAEFSGWARLASPAGGAQPANRGRSRIIRRRSPPRDRAPRPSGCAAPAA